MNVQPGASRFTCLSRLELRRTFAWALTGSETPRRAGLCQRRWPRHCRRPSSFKLLRGVVRARVTSLPSEKRAGPLTRRPGHHGME